MKTLRSPNWPDSIKPSVGPSGKCQALGDEDWGQLNTFQLPLQFHAIQFQFNFFSVPSMIIRLICIQGVIQCVMYDVFI